MIIRQARPTDRKEYLLTQKETFPFLDTKRDSRLFDLKIKRKEIFVAEIDSEYAGHLCFSDYSIIPPFLGSVFVEGLAVKDQFRGKGIGTALMEHLVRFCRKKKIPAIYIGTGDKKGNKAVKFYEKQGFRKVGSLKDIDPDSEYDYNQIFFAVLVKDWKKS